MSKSENNIRVLISGGGTGGHLFPALAIAQAIRAEKPDADILFAGAKGKIEEHKVPEAGYKIELLNITGFQRRITFQNVLFFFRLISSLMKARKIINRFKPHVVVGVGGYASGPVLRIASKKKIPTLIQEQNSFPGITNRLLAEKVNKICVAYDGTERFFPADKIIKTGNPVRENLFRNQISREEAVRFFGLDPNKKVVLSLGGSGGARTINRALSENIGEFVRNDIQLIWQTGKFYFEESKASVDEKYHQNIKIYDFIKEMDYAFRAADVVISRAGAATISELCLAAKPAILVPSPNVAEDHQTKNALALSTKKAAILVKDSDAQINLTAQTINLVKNAEQCTVLTKNIAEMALPDSAKIIAKEIFDLLKS